MSGNNPLLAVTFVASIVLVSIARTDAFSTVQRASSSRGTFRQYLSPSGNNGDVKEPKISPGDGDQDFMIDEEPFLLDEPTEERRSQLGLGHDLTKERRSQYTPSQHDFSDLTSAFDCPIDVLNIYGDCAESMVRDLPALFDQCKQFENTGIGREFLVHRLPMFILGSNKLEGTMGADASERETFQFILKILEADAGAFHVIPQEANEDPFPWEEDGRNDSTDAWFQQC